MSHSQKNSDAASLKKALNIDSIPEDVAAIIIKWIRSWSAGGNNDQRVKGIRARDSTLRGLSLSSKRAKDLFHSSLVENLTLSFESNISIYRLLYESGVDGSKVKSLLCRPTATDRSEEDHRDSMQEYVDFFGLPPSGQQDQIFAAIDKSRNELIRNVYEKLPNLQVLEIEDTSYGTPLRRKIDGDFLIPLQCLTHSLKTLYVQMPLMEEKFKFLLSGRNIIWLLVFCTSLERASLGATFSVDDFRYVSDFHQTYEGLSPVKELALNIAFVYNPKEKKTFWTSKKVGNKRFIGGTMKSEAVHHLLSVTNQLFSFEISTRSEGEGAHDGIDVDSSCIFGALKKSHLSLRHLRQLLNERGSSTSVIDYSLFNGLVSLTLEGFGFKQLYAHRQIKLPASLSRIILPYYHLYNPDVQGLDFSDEAYLIQFLKSRGKELPNLMEVAVPQKPMRTNATFAEEPTKAWTRNREVMEGLEIFESGKTKLTRWLPGDVIGRELRRNPISVHRWMYA